MNCLYKCLAVALVAIALGLAWYLLVAFGVEAQESEILVNNHGQLRNGYVELNWYEQGIGQSFTTGSDGGGYWLDKVVVHLERSRDSAYITLSGQIYDVDSDGSRGNQLMTLTDTDVHHNYQNYTFTAPENSFLLPDTTYMFVIDCVGGCANDNYLRFAKTLRDDEDADGESDWEIDEQFVLASNGWSLDDDLITTDALVMKVKGRFANKPYIVSDGVEITSSPTNGNTYGFGETIAFDVEFDSQVVVEESKYGVPELVVRIGDSSNPVREQPLDYVGGSDTDTLTFEYEVQPDDRDSNGIQVLADDLILNHSTIKHHSNGLDVFLSHDSVGSSGQLPGHKVDGSVATPMARLSELELNGVALSPIFASDMARYVALVRGEVGETTVNATPETGASVSITPADSDAEVSGHQVQLDDGANEITITVTKSGSISTTYALLVTRQERETTRLRNISISSTPLQGGAYGRGETVVFKVIFTKDVVVDTFGGTPKLPIQFQYDPGNVNNTWFTRDFLYARGSGSNTLEFQHVVTNNDGSSEVPNFKFGMRYRADRLTANGGSIRHAANGSDASLAHAATSIIEGHRVNGKRQRPVAKLNSLSLSGLTLSPAFDSNTVNYTAEAAGNISATTVTFTFDDGTSVSVTPTDSDSATQGHQVALSEGANEITITSTRADRAPRTYTVAVNRQPAFAAVSEIAITSDPGSDGTYSTGDTIEAAITFDEAVTVDTASGIPFLPLTIGSDTRNANYASIDTNNRSLTFSYTVVSADGDQNGVSIAANGLTLNGGAIKGRGTTTNASLAHPSLVDQSGHLVNKIPKIVTGGVSITSTPQAEADTYGVGEIIAFSVTFDSNVVVDTTDGTPRLEMIFDPAVDDSGLRRLLYARGSGGATLEFEYTVQAADRDDNGITMVPNALKLNLGTIVHATTGKGANLNHARPGQQGIFPDHKVDGGPQATSSPPKPLNLAAEGQDRMAILSWDSPPATVIFTYHEYRHKGSNEELYPATWSQIADSGRGGDNEDGFAVPSLTNGVSYDFQVRAGNSVGPSDPSGEANALAGDGLGICNRTQAVHVAILRELSGVSDCADVTATRLGQVDSVFVQQLAGGLKAGDFAGLSAATAVSVRDSSELTELPNGIFTGLSSVGTITLVSNGISALPADIFDGLPALKVVRIDSNQLAELPDGIFDAVTTLETLEIGDNQLTELPDGIFDQLTKLDTLWLNDNQLTELPEGIFDELTALEDLRLDANQLTEMPEGIFDNLPLLIDIDLDGNQLTGLPHGIFAGKTSLVGLQLGNNAVSPMLLLVTLEQGDGLEFKGVIPTGAPFDIVLPLVVTNGNIVGGASTITIGIGDTESGIIQVNRAPDASGNPTVDIGTLPEPPLDHSGYRLFKSTSLPLTITFGGVQSIALSSDPGVDGTYATGDTINVAVTFGDAVTVDTGDGTPCVPITIGTATRNASYASIDSTNMVLTFSYTVVSADDDQNGISIAANGLSLNGGTIEVHGTNVDAVLDHAALGDQTGHLVNKIPTIVANGVSITSTPQAETDTYGAGETIAFSVTFDSNVVVGTTGGTPRLAMRFGDPNNPGTDKYLQYVRGSGSATLVFEYVIQAADRDSNGIYMRPNQLELDGGTIKHATTGKDAVLDHSRPGQNGDFPSHKVDGSLVVAMLTDLSLSGVTLSPAFTAGITTYTATVGRDIVQATITSTAETGATATVLPADSDTGTTGHQVALDRGANEITITVSRTGATNGTYSVTVNRRWAEVQRLSFTSDPGTDGTYSTGDVINVAVTFDAPVSVDTTDGTPHVVVLVGNYDRTAVFTSIDATNQVLTFSYTVIASDSDQGGIEIQANTLTLDGGSIKREGTDLDAIMEHDALPPDSGHLVNKTPRIVNNGVSLVSTPGATADTYGLGEIVSFSVTFDSNVVVDTTGGTPSLMMVVGYSNNSATDRSLPYVGGSGTTTLEFDYVVQAADRDANGIFMDADQLQLNSGTIKHATTGRDANLDHPQPGRNGNFRNHKLDGSLGGLRPANLCGAQVGSTEGIAQDAELDLCWDVGIAVPPGNDVVIELRVRYSWYDGEPFGPWGQIGSGDDYTPCVGGSNTCVKHTVKGRQRGGAATYEMRMRNGSTLLTGSPHLLAQAPNSNSAPLNSRLSGCYLIDSLEPCGKATGRFWMDLEFTDPALALLATETVQGLEPADLEITNGTVVSVEPWSGAVYRVVVDPTTLGQPVNVSLPANTVLGVGEGITSDGRNNYTRNNNASNSVTIETEAP